MSSSRTENLVEVVMPQMGVSVAEGTVTEWLKAVGEEVAADETLCVLTTDKIDVEVPSPASGVVAEILVSEGETVAVGTVLALLGESGASDGGARPGVSRKGLRHRHCSPLPGALPLATRRRKAVAIRTILKSTGLRSIRRSFGGLRRSTGVNLREVEGHGVGGRVRKADLAAFIDSGGVKQEKVERGRFIRTLPTSRIQSRRRSP